METWRFSFLYFATITLPIVKDSQKGGVYDDIHISDCMCICDSMHRD